MKKRYNLQLSVIERTTFCNTIKTLISPVYNDIFRGTQNNIKGCDIILNNLASTLDKFNINVIGLDIEGCPFNTDTMEAISSIPTDDENKKGTVASLMECGFFDKDTNKTFVYAKVIVFN